MGHSDGIEPVHETMLGEFLNGLVSAVCVKRISGGRGKGQETESAEHFLLRPTLPQRTNFEVLAHTGWQI